MMHDKSPLELAIQIAIEAHAGQKDKAGNEYILHCLRVMLKMDTTEEMIAAVLHDVVEDSPLSVNDLETSGFSPKVLEAVDLLTKDVENESYEQSIEKVKKSPLAVKIKLADLEDNMDTKRISNMTQEDIDRLEKYHKAWDVLTQESID